MFTGNRKWLTGSILILILVLLISCAPASPTTSSKPTTSSQPTTATGPAGKVVILMETSDWNGIGGDPATSKGGRMTTINSAISEGLIHKDKDAKIIPALATSWEFSDNGLSLKFNLQKNVKFHSGNPFTAKDVKFSIDREAAETSKFVYAAELRRNIDKVEVVDDYTVIFRFKQGYPAILDQLFDYVKIVDSVYCQQVGDDEFAKKPSAAGPFKWTGYQQDVFWEAEAVNNHYRKTPEVKNVRVGYVPEASTRLAMLKTGEADIALLSGEHVAEIKADSNFKIVTTQNTVVVQIVFGDLSFPEQKLPFQDIKVRKALSYAIDRQAICDKVLLGAAKPYGSVLAPWHPGYDEAQTKVDPYDPKKAKELLTEAGFPNGFDTQLIWDTSQNKVAGEAVSNYLNEVGIRAKLKLVDSGTWTTIGTKAPETGLFLLNTSFVARFHPATPLQQMYANTGGWRYIKVIPPNVDNAVMKLSTAFTAQDIAPLAREAEKVIKEAMLRTELYSVIYNRATGPRVEYWENISGHSHFQRMEYIRLKPGAK